MCKKVCREILDFLHTLATPGEGAFSPDDPITREQLAAFLYRYAGYQGYDLATSGDLEAFPDGENSSEWAAGALVWAAEHGILSGKENRMLDPQGTAARAEAAQMLMNFMESGKHEALSSSHGTRASAAYSQSVSARSDGT